MSEATQPVDQNEFDVSPEIQLESLKARADLLGVKYHPSISYEKLLERIREASANQENAGANNAPTESINEKRKRLRAEAAKLVRVNITCMNPFKREWEGEIFSAGNSTVGTFKRYVPFNTPDGWHVEQILLNTIRERKAQIFYTERVAGKEVRRGKLMPEFNIEVLPPLTEKELQELARRQALAKGE